MTIPEITNEPMLSTDPEWRITWAFVPMSQNPTRVDFILAKDSTAAKKKLRNKVERTEGRILGFYTCDEVTPS